MKHISTYKLLLGLGSFVLILQMWLNSGNMSVYAATLTNPHSMKGYITNYDDVHYYMNYKMICDVTPKEEWKSSYTLRRVGLFIIGYPFFRLFGFYYGGEIVSFLLVVFAFLYLIKFVKEKYGLNAAYACILVTSCYTGIMYWIGSPFAQNTIFPICVFSYIIMESLASQQEFKKSIGLWFLMGLLFTGYDLFIIFIPAVFIYYLIDRKWQWAILSAVIIFLPQIIIELTLKACGAKLLNENTGLYSLILDAWFNHFSWNGLLPQLSGLPFILIRNLLDSGFIVLPTLFVITYFLARTLYSFVLNRIEISILSGTFLLWLFLNLAPHYEHQFQLRGIGMARIYQPVFIVMIMYLVRFAGFLSGQKTKIKQYYFALLLVCFMICIWLNVGGWFHNNATQIMYHNFYHHSDADAYFNNIEKFGRHPLGFQP